VTLQEQHAPQQTVPHPALQLSNILDALGGLERRVDDVLTVNHGILLTERGTSSIEHPISRGSLFHLTSRPDLLLYSPNPHGNALPMSASRLAPLDDLGPTTIRVGPAPLVSHGIRPFNLSSQQTSGLLPSRAGSRAAITPSPSTRPWFGNLAFTAHGRLRIPPRSRTPSSGRRSRFVAPEQPLLPGGAITTISTALSTTASDSGISAHERRSAGRAPAGKLVNSAHTASAATASAVSLWGGASSARKRADRLAPAPQHNKRSSNPDLLRLHLRAVSRDWMAVGTAGTPRSLSSVADVPTPPTATSRPAPPSHRGAQPDPVRPPPRSGSEPNGEHSPAEPTAADPPPAVTPLRAGLCACAPLHMCVSSPCLAITPPASSSPHAGEIPRELPFAAAASTEAAASAAVPGFPARAPTDTPPTSPRGRTVGGASRTAGLRVAIPPLTLVPPLPTSPPPSPCPSMASHTTTARAAEGLSPSYGGGGSSSTSDFAHRHHLTSSPVPRAGGFQARALVDLPCTTGPGTSLGTSADHILASQHTSPPLSPYRQHTSLHRGLSDPHLLPSRCGRLAPITPPHGKTRTAVSPGHECIPTSPRSTSPPRGGDSPRPLQPLACQPPSLPAALPSPLAQVSPSGASCWVPGLLNRGASRGGGSVRDDSSYTCESSTPASPELSPQALPPSLLANPRQSAPTFERPPQRPRAPATPTGTNAHTPEGCLCTPRSDSSAGVSGGGGAGGGGGGFLRWSTTAESLCESLSPLTNRAATRSGSGGVDGGGTDGGGGGGGGGAATSDSTEHAVGAGAEGPQAGRGDGDRPPPGGQVGEAAGEAAPGGERCISPRAEYAEWVPGPRRASMARARSASERARCTILPVCVDGMAHHCDKGDEQWRSREVASRRAQRTRFACMTSLHRHLIPSGS